MKAVRIHTYGGPEVLSYEEAPRPQVRDDDVLIRVGAAGVNPVDWKVRQGYLQKVLHHRMPLILGWDVSGVVEAVGGRVTAFQPGDEVYSRPDIARDGADAELIAVRESEVAFKPRSLNHVQAAGVPLTALTAWQALCDAAGLAAGQRVLIHGAAGGVGHFAVQIAKWSGAYVIGTASNRNLEFVHSLGADEVIDYQTTRFEEVVREVDTVFDPIGGEVQDRSWSVLKPGGVLVSIISPPSSEIARSRGVRPAYIFGRPDAQGLTQIAKLIDNGRIKPVIETVLPLNEARRAHELSQSGHARGRIVLRVAA